MHNYKTGRKAGGHGIKIDGAYVSLWIHELGGLQAAIDKISKSICDGCDYTMICVDVNVSPRICRMFINKQLGADLIAKHDANLKINSRIRHSKPRNTPNPNKGKTYREIYGTNRPACGFKRGLANPNFTRSKYVGCKCINKYGQKFRSSYEVAFSELMIDNKIAFNTEHRMLLCNNRVKIVDFIINNMLVEITGYAYPAWKDDFDVKMNLLHITYPEHKIIIISTRDNMTELREKHSNYASILPIEDSDDLVKFFSENHSIIIPIALQPINKSSKN